MAGVPRQVALAFVATLAACGGSSTPPAPTNPTPVVTTTITITAAGASPRNIVVDLGARVRFINNDTRAHNMSSDPHPDHTDCPEINQAGFLLPGQQRDTGNLVLAETCGFHDHDNPGNVNLRGSITIR